MVTSKANLARTDCHRLTLGHCEGLFFISRARCVSSLYILAYSSPLLEDTIFVLQQKNNLPSYGGQWIPSSRLCWQYLQTGNNEASWSPRPQPHRDLNGQKAGSEGHRNRRVELRRGNLFSGSHAECFISWRSDWGHEKRAVTSAFNECIQQGGIIIQSLLSESILL